MKKAFTLIELLVVIAIIAILAAILFPVFAQAKEAAKKTVCLSNAKNVGTANYMYLSDYDDTMSPVLHEKNLGGIITKTNPTGQVTEDYYELLQPYIKNLDMFYCPDRTDWPLKGNGTPQCEDGVNPLPRCLGYGYNQGLVSDGGYGVVMNQDPNSVYGDRYGKNFSAITAPASTVTYSDTYDTPTYSTTMDNIFSTLPDMTSTKSIRHNGIFLVSFADGHASHVAFETAEYPGYGMIGLPKNQSQALWWCSDPNVVGNYAANGNSVSGYPLQANLETCTQAVADLYTNSTVNP